MNMDDYIRRLSMKIIHSIASYTGNSRKNMEQILNDEVKNTIVKITENSEYAKKVLHQNYMTVNS